MALAVAVAVGVVAVDQLTKNLAMSRLADHSVHVVGPLDLTLEHNTGSAFSLFQGDSPVLVVIGVVLVGALLALVYRSRTTGRAAILGLIIGGALGNLGDRLFRGGHGAVVDFVELHFWPTFNVADSCIVIGCILLVVSLLRAPAPPGPAAVPATGAGPSADQASADDGMPSGLPDEGVVEPGSGHR